MKTVLTTKINVQEHISSGAWCFDFGLDHNQLPYLMCASSEGSDEPAGAGSSKPSLLAGGIRIKFI